MIRAKEQKIAVVSRETLNTEDGFGRFHVKPSRRNHKKIPAKLHQQHDR